MVQFWKYGDLLLPAMIFCSELLFQSFNSIQISDWRSPSLVFDCSYGIQLITLDSNQPTIQKTLTDISPHYSLQIITDIFGYYTIDGSEAALIFLDTNQVAQYIRNSLGTVNYYNECHSNSAQQLSIQTIIADKSHSSSTLSIQIKTTTDSPWQDEAYLIRNLQIFYSKCYQTCQTCSDQYSNSCLTCFTSTGPISGVCNTCISEINKTFLLVTQGCTQECLTGYSFDSNRICYLNENLQVHLQLNYVIGTQDLTLVQSQVSTRTILICSSTLQLFPYYTSEILETTQSFTSITTMIRLRVSLFLFKVWSSSQSISILLNGVQIDNIILNGLIITTQQSVILYSDSTYQSCGSDQYIQIRLELNYQISSTSPIISFQANNVINQSIFWSVINIDIEQLVCSTNCNSCTTTDKCQTCNLGYYLHKGQCKTICPNYSTLSSNSCIDYDEEYLTEYGREATYLVKEFFDTSTSIDRINSLFTLQTSSSNNFAKGSGIYFSYMPDKRVFGGNLVWINAVFLFQISLQQYYQKIQIRFQAVLGDSSSVNTNVFLYRINFQSQQSLTYQSLNPISSTQLWGDYYPDYIFQINEEIDYNPLLDNPTLQILFECQNSNTVVNQAFCAIQNLFITTIQYQSICGDNIISENEECDDGNNIPFDGCFNCKYQCNDLCQFCIRGQCLYDDKYDLELNFNFNLDNITFIESTQDENIIVIIDDYQFNQNCSILCYLCSFGQCQQCQSGYYLDYLYNECIPQCGDEIIAGNEQCDDGNNNSTDGCYNCQIVNYNECDENCAFCYFSECIRCNYGFTLKNNECQSICGDNLVNKELENNKQIEECDNPNDEGCQNCQITTGYDCVGQDISICWTCGEYCTTCTYNNDELGCDECNGGYYATGTECFPCDDNCITCTEYSYLCTSCYRDDCELCEATSGLYTDKTLKECINICGDGIYVQYYEQCDDGNTESNDGCDSQCNQEYSANDDEASVSAIHYKGSLSNDLSIQNQLYMDYSCTDISITIEEYETSNFEYSVVSSDDDCQITFTFYKTIFKYNIIHVFISYLKSTSSSRLLTDEQIYEIKVTPVYQLILSADEAEQAQQIENAQSNLSYIIWIVAPLSILFGVFEYFWSVLEILSWINNFYFLNVNYPFNVQVLFLNSDWSSIINFPTYNELNQPDCDYYFEAPTRFQEKDMDPLFINNAQIPFSFLFTALLIYLVFYSFQILFVSLDKCFKKESSNFNRVLTLFQFKNATFQDTSTLADGSFSANFNKVYTHNHIFFKARKYFEKTSKVLKTQVKSTLSICLLDISMAITLQLIFARQFQYLVILINELLALGAIFLIYYQLKQSYTILNTHEKLAKCEHFEEIYGCYYDGINIENKFGYLINLIGLIQKILYIFFSVYFYYNPLLQTSMCFFSTSFNLFLIVYSNPFESTRELISSIISEGGVSLIIFITVLFAIDDQVNWLESKTKTNMGWVIIGICFLCFASEVLTLIYEIIKAFVQKIKELYHYCTKKEETNNEEFQRYLDSIRKKQQQETSSPSPIKQNRNLHFIPTQK